MPNHKFEELKIYLQELGKQGLCLAFSGGIDSLLLLYLCKDLNIIAATIKSEFQTADEINFTKDICNNWNIKQIILNTAILQNPLVMNNPKDRCYHCKKNMFEKFIDAANQNNCKYLIDGTNFDDLKEYRPGKKALLELGIISPFAKFQITKKEIREYAKELGLPFYNKPSTPCLATRFPYGTTLTAENLKVVEEAETILKNTGFNECRVRIHGDIARIEIPTEQFQIFLDNKSTITKSLKSLGIRYITLDIEGLRRGSMDMP